MKIGLAALIAIVLMVSGLLLYGVADVKLGGYVAMGGLLIAMGAIWAAHAWAWTSENDDAE